MEEWEKRLIKERDELAERHRKLNCFVQSAAYLKLSQVEQDLLIEQGAAMFLYVCALSRRIELYGVE